MSYGAAHQRKQGDKEARQRAGRTNTRDVTFSDWKGAVEPDPSIISAKGPSVDPLDASILIEEMASKPLQLSSHRGQFTPLGLADAVRQNHAALEGGKLSLVGCSITNISELPTSIARDIHTVYLSNNDIVSLNGVTQFNGLRNLSLCNNSISYLGQLRILGELEHLEKLSLDGNTVASMPFYRLSVVGLCRHLVQLDGVRVSPGERTLANKAASEITGYFERLRVNGLRHVALQHMAGVMRVHGDLHEFLRPEGEEAGRMHVQQMMNHRPSDALRILIDGAVYRWLQISGADTFDCLVQDTARSLHLQMIQSFGAAQRTQMLRSPEKLLQHWREVVEGLIRHQELASFRLFNECEVCKGGEVRKSHSELSAVATDLGVLQALHFREPLGVGGRYGLLRPAFSRPETAPGGLPRGQGAG